VKNNQSLLYSTQLTCNQVFSSIAKLPIDFDNE